MTNCTKWLRRSLGAALLALAPCALAPPAALAQGIEPVPAWERLNSVSLQAGHIIAAKSDFSDFWPTENDSDTISLAYERMIGPRTGVEVMLGRVFSTESGKTDLEEKFYSKFSAPTLAVSGKYYSSPIAGDALAFYAGAGVDYAVAQSKMTYKLGTVTSRMDDKNHVFGLHALLGGEYVLLKDPVSKQYYDAPVGIFFEYRYVWMSINNADKEIIADLNDRGLYDEPYHDLDMGGHAWQIGLRWHF